MTETIQEDDARPGQTSSLTIRIEPKLEKILKTLANEEDRTVSSLARILIREALIVRMGGSAEDARRGSTASDRIYRKIMEAWAYLDAGMSVPFDFFRDPRLPPRDPNEPV